MARWTKVGRILTPFGDENATAAPFLDEQPYIVSARPIFDQSSQFVNQPALEIGTSAAAERDTFPQANPSTVDTSYAGTGINAAQISATIPVLNCENESTAIRSNKILL